MNATSRPWRRQLLLLGFALAIPGFAGDFEESPAYFVNLYGLPESTKTVSSHSFFHAGETIVLKGRFSVREYRQRDLQVQTVFVPPHLKLAAVTFRLPRAWTAEERDASLAAFGSRWLEVRPNSFLSSEGVRATYRRNALHFISPEIAGAIEEQAQPPVNQR